MQRDTTKRFYVIHSWVGALTGVLMFVIAFTGAVSVFGRPELKIWANEVSHQPVALNPAAIEQLLQRDAALVPADYRDNVQIIMPGVRRSPYLSIGFERETALPDGGEEHHVIRFDHHPESFELVRRREGEPRELFESDRKDIADFLITFHADLHLGNPFGLMLTGLLGLTFFGSIVTGVITHRKVLKEMFTFRPFRSYRLLLTDSHKVLGVWGVMFHTVIAFTGAFLGLAVVMLLPAAALVSFEGDLDQMVETFLPVNVPERSGAPSDLMIANVLSAVSANDSGPIVSAQLLEGTDVNGVAMVFTLAGDGIVGHTHRYQAASAELLDTYTQFAQIGGASGALLEAMFPLHFGNFGGTAVKYIWFVMGLSTAMLALSGMMIWLERRVYGPAGSLSMQAYDRISRLVMGACGGVVLATIGLFYVQRLALSSVEQTGPWLFGGFFGIWMVAIGWALVIPSVYKATRHLFLAAGVLAVLVPLLDLATSDSHLFNIASGDHAVVAGVDLTVFLIGVLTIWASRKLPTARETQSRDKDSEASEAVTPTLPEAVA